MRAVAEQCRSIDELAGGVRDAIGRVVVGMRVELELQHFRVYRVKALADAVDLESRGLSG